MFVFVASFVGYFTRLLQIVYDFFANLGFLSATTTQAPTTVETTVPETAPTTIVRG